MTEEKPELENLCSMCGKHEAEPLHTCPYQEDIHGDYITECDCCQECIYECQMAVGDVLGPTGF